MSDTPLNRDGSREREPDPYRVARLWAQWHLGSPTWADNILFAYNNPEKALADLNAKRAEYGLEQQR